MENQPPIPWPWFRQRLRNEPTPQQAPPSQPTPTQPTRRLTFAQLRPPIATPTAQPEPEPQPQPQPQSLQLPPQLQSPEPQPQLQSPQPQPQPEPRPQLQSPQPQPEPQPQPKPQPQIQSPQPGPQPEPQPQLQSPQPQSQSQLQSTQPQPLQPRPPTPSLQTLEPQLTTPSLSPPTPPPQPRPSNTPEAKLSTPLRSLALPPQTQPQPSQRLRDPPSPPPSPNRQYSYPFNRTPLNSPKAKQLQPLVPTQPKSIIVQEASNNEKMIGQSSQASAIAPPNYKRANKDATSDGEVSMKSTAQKKKDDSEMSVITVAGENMGAYMELGSALHHENNKTRKHPDQRLHNQGHDNELTRDEGKSKGKEKATKPASKTKPITSLANSNVQSVNNSILFNTSCTTRSPGVHLTLASHRAIRTTVPHSKGEVKLSKEPQVANHDH